VTDLERLFEQARSGGASYFQALREVEGRTGLDPDTIARTLRRVRRRGKAAPTDRKENDD